MKVVKIDGWLLDSKTLTDHFAVSLRDAVSILCFIIRKRLNSYDGFFEQF